MFVLGSDALGSNVGYGLLVVYCIYSCCAAVNQGEPEARAVRRSADHTTYYQFRSPGAHFQAPAT